jgi:hypothetical protein
LPGTGNGGHAGIGGPRGVGGGGGSGGGGEGGSGSIAGDGIGGALDNAGTASFIGVTVNFTNNQANGGAGGRGGAGGLGVGGDGGNGVVGGHGGIGDGGTGGSAGAGGGGLGGAIFNSINASLTIDPRLGARKGSRQSKATDVITANQANRGLGGAGGQGGGAFAGLGGQPNGVIGFAIQGITRADAPPGTGQGGGLVQSPTMAVAIKNTRITGNTASTSNDDVLNSSE